MRKILILLLCTFALGVSAQTHSDSVDAKLRQLAEEYQANKEMTARLNLAHVETSNGLFVFINATPDAQYQVIASYGFKDRPNVDYHFPLVRDVMITKVKREHPDSQAVIFYLVGTSVTFDAIRFK